MNDKRITIDRLRPGESAVVEYIGDIPLSGRLRDLGLISGTRVTCIGRAPLGDPAAYMIRGALIALRRNDARGIFARTEGERYG